MGTTFFKDWRFTFVSPSWCKLLCFLNRVLEALTRKFVLDKYVSLLTIAKRCPPNLTGADLYALCADAWTNGAKQKVKVSWQFSRHHRCPANIWFVQVLQLNSSVYKCGMCIIYTQFITLLVRHLWNYPSDCHVNGSWVWMATDCRPGWSFEKGRGSRQDRQNRCGEARWFFQGLHNNYPKQLNAGFVSICFTLERESVHHIFVQVLAWSMKSMLCWKWESSVKFFRHDLNLKNTTFLHLKFRYWRCWLSSIWFLMWSSDVIGCPI